MANGTNQPRLFIGTFDSEKYWKDGNMAILPTLHYDQTDAIVSVMDEMQFVFCENRSDTLLTRFPINNWFKDYLNCCGFDFSCNTQPIINNDDIITKNGNIFQLVDHSNSSLEKFIPGNSKLSPFSVLPAIESFCNRFNLNCEFPDLETIKKVNSKLYSFNISKNILNSLIGHIVSSSKELNELGEKLFKKDNVFLIKDPLGVSGKGIFSVNSSFILKRICHYLESQEAEGKQTLFLVEPMLKKEIDFSCQIDIAKNGQIALISLHTNEVNGFKHSKCQYADKELLKILENVKYLDKIELIGKQLLEDKYFGPVCIDSMKLMDGTIRFVVEINARKSMSLFHHFVRKKYPFVQNSLMIQLNLTISKFITIEEFLSLLQKENLLFNSSQNDGILPLSGNALIINSTNSKLPYRAILFAIILSSSFSKTASIYMDLKELLTRIGIKVVV